MLAASFDKPGGATCCATPLVAGLSRLSPSLIGLQYSDDSLLDKAWLHKYPVTSYRFVLSLRQYGLLHSYYYYYLHFLYLSFISILNRQFFPGYLTSPIPDRLCSW